MKTTISLEDAEQNLRLIVSNYKTHNWLPTGRHYGLIKDIILGSHLTYRYILLTAILSKYTNPAINPLALQAGSELQGAYDARSVCHKVIVPLEREILGGRLGESNEPFLNKPARFKEISLTNAVRNGKDRDTLSKIFAVLSDLNTTDDATQALNDAIYFIFQRQSRDIYEIISSKAGNQSGKVLSFVRNFTAKSFNGETVVLVAGASLKLLLSNALLRPIFKVHPVHQSGASSKEVADIDIFDAEKLFLSVEVKDKKFTQSDIDHAVKKTSLANQNRLLFVMGPQAITENEILVSAEKSWEEMGFFINFINVLDLVKTAMTFSPEGLDKKFISHVGEFAKLARVQDEIIQHFEQCIHHLQ